MTKDSVSFDRAASYYDATRNTDADTLARILDILTRRFGGADHVLELGVGTGQLALPAAERGIAVIGLDMSAAMMAVLKEKAGGVSPFPLVQGDATRLPVRTASIDGAYARWVLHLIPNWLDVLHELDRVVRPGGAVAVEPGGYTGAFREVHERFVEILGETAEAPGLSPIDRDRELDRAFDEVGWRVEHVVPVSYRRSGSLAETFAEVPTKRWSWTWRVPDEELRAAVDEVRAWSAERFGDLDRPVPAEPTTWRIYGRAG
jgi:SAM-dependent methyltransferase